MLNAFRHAEADAPVPMTLLVPSRMRSGFSRARQQADSFDPATAENTVTLAMTDYAAFVVLPPLMARLSMDALHINVRVCGMFGRDEAITLLDSGEANLAIGFPVETSARIISSPLFFESFACVVREDTRRSRVVQASRLSRRRRIFWSLRKATAPGSSI